MNVSNPDNTGSANGVATQEASWRFILQAGLSMLLLIMIAVFSSMPGGGAKRIWSSQTVKLNENDRPDFSERGIDDENWGYSPLNEIRQADGIIWIRTDVHLGGKAVANPPLALYLSGVFSAQVFWDGERIGAKGTPGASAQTEIPGPIDSVIYIPDHLINPGRHSLAIRLSSFHACYSPATLVHDLSLGAFRADPRRQLRYYAQPLLLGGVFLFFGFHFLRIGYNAGAKAPVVLAAFSLFILLQLLAETSRAFSNYGYDWHFWRTLVVWLMATLAGAALFVLVYLRTRWRPLVPIGAIAVVIALALAWITVGFDGKTVVSLQVLAIGPILAAPRHMWRKGRDLIVIACGGLGLAWIIASVLSELMFLDRSFYLVSAAFLSLAWFWVSSGAARAETSISHPKTRQFFTPKNQGVIERVPLEKVMYLQAVGNFAALICEEGRQILHHKRLGQIMDDPPAGFSRIHKSYAVNLAFVKKMNSHSGSRYSVTLLDGSDIPVSRYRATELRAALFGKRCRC